MPTTSHPNGITNAIPTTTLAGLMDPDPTRTIRFWDDFTSLIQANYTVTQVTGTGTFAKAGTAGYGGLAIITNTTGSADATEIQATNASFTTQGVTNSIGQPTWNPALALNVPMQGLWFKTSFQVDSAANTNVYAGLQVINTTPAASNREGIYFVSTAGVVTLVVATGSATTTSATVATLANATNVTLGFRYTNSFRNSNAGSIEIFVNETAVLNLKTVTNLPATTDVLAPVVHLVNRTALAHTCTIDYILAEQNRV